MAKRSFKACIKHFRHPGYTNESKALTRKRLYKMIISDGIREGTYILIKEFVLAWANRIDGEGEVLSGLSQLLFKFSF